MWFVWMSIGCFLGVLIMCIVTVGKFHQPDCLNCDGIIERDADIRSLTRSRDNFRERCDQQEVLIHSLRTKLGIKNHKEGLEYYRRMGVA